MIISESEQSTPGQSEKVGGANQSTESLIDEQETEVVDPVTYSSESDEEVKNYKLNMENSVERPKGQR